MFFAKYRVGKIKWRTFKEPINPTKRLEIPSRLMSNESYGSLRSGDGPGYEI